MVIDEATGGGSPSTGDASGPGSSLMGSSQGLDTLVDARGASGTFDVGYLRPVQGDENTGNILMERELQTCVRSTDGGQSRCPAVGVQLPRHAFGDPEGGERVGGIRPAGD